MGVKGYLGNIYQNYKNVYKTKLCTSYKIEETDKLDSILFIDGNCIIHDSLSIIKNDFSSEINTLSEKVKERMYNYTKDFVYNVIVFDGEPPVPKQFLQKKRRENTNDIGKYILPGTKQMDIIEQKIIYEFQDDFTFFSTTKTIGEGEQKILQILKNIKKINNRIFKKFYFLSFDSDVIILLQLHILIENLVDEYYFICPSFNIIIDINKFNLSINKKYKLKNNSLIYFLIYISIFSGNDFVLRLEELKDYSFQQIAQLISLEIKNIKYVKDDKTIFKDVFFNIISLILKINNTNTTCKHLKESFTYYNVIKWFIIYFLKNEFINCEYMFELPCIECIQLIRKNNFDYNFNNNSLGTINHLNFVLGEKNYELSKIYLR